MNTLELIRQCYRDIYELLRVQILMLLLYLVNALTLILAFLSLKCPLLITSAEYIQVFTMEANTMNPYHTAPLIGAV